MFNVTISPVNLAQGIRPGPGSPAIRMGDTSPIAKAGAAAMLLGALTGAATAWVGFSTGDREKGALSGTGYVIGSLGALGAFSGIIGLGLLGLSAIGEDAPRQTVQVTPSQNF